ncbi:hypothetical protein JHK87_038785 [Glycine soja]|nr:hypothetical protein JHK87_038785 [Glycine soja]
MLRGESSSNSPNASSRLTYHVFLSFRTEGTHLDFANTLCTSLQRNGISTFRYDKQKERGYVILEKLHKVIEQCLVVIVLLSENYASSTWCLDELHKILKSKRVLGTPVFPLFYDVVPSDVRHQKNKFAEAFEEHATRPEEDKVKVQKWRESLHEVAGFSGWESKNWKKEELIEEIIESVWTKLRPKLPSYDDGLVGIDSRVEKMNSLLKLELKDKVCFIGIWGMGGIGKTTLARVVFKKIRNKFDISCFLENVREISQNSDGMLSLQGKLLSHMKMKDLKIQNLDEGKSIIGGILFNNKVLLVLDDVNDIRQLENLSVNDQKWLGPGSRIIIITRDMEVLRSHGTVESYKIDLLNSDESLQLFSQKAFKRDQPLEHLLQLSKVAVQQAGGLPLAIEMMGSSFCGRSESQWKEFLEVKEYTKKDVVMDKLIISYDGLPPNYKILFLDIACFFNGWVKEHVTQILTICGRYPANGIDVLIDKSLATYDGSRLWMHDLLQEMGRKIVVEECPIDAGKRSRLWSPQDTDQALKRNKGIVLQSSTQPYNANWDPEAFSKMYNLKFLVINYHNIQVPRGIKCLCSSMKFLQWTGCTLKALPLGVKLEELVELKMRYSKIKKIWSGSQHFAKLKFIDLSHSEDLIEGPIVSGVPCLEILLLEGCINLVEVHQSVGQHKKLVLLNLKGCINLQTLPTKFEMDSLEELILSGCSKVKKLPNFGKNMQHLSLVNLEKCKNLLWLPKSIWNLKSLRKLSICGCSKFSTLPNSMNENGSLEELDVSGTPIREITSSKVCLENLKELSFGGRNELASNSLWNLHQRISMHRRQQVPKELILPTLSRLTSLKFLNLSYCDLNDESIPDSLGSLLSLLGLNLSGNNFVSPPTRCISNLHTLQSLTLIDCPRLESLPMLPPSAQCLGTTNSTQMKPLNSDAYMLWKIYELHMNQTYFLYTHSLPTLPLTHPNYFHKVCAYQMEDRPHFLFIIPGREIQKWNEVFFLIDPSHHPYNRLGSDSVASIIVDVPNYLVSSGWLGIAICLALEPPNMQHSSPSHVSPHPVGNEDTCIYYWACKVPQGEPDLTFPIGPKFSHFVYECNEEKCQLQLIFYVENHSKPWKPRIRKCASVMRFCQE